MAKEVKKTVTKVKIKKKLWFKIVSPTTFGGREVGESFLVSPETAIGRIVQVNLKDLTGNVRDQNVYLNFQIVKAQGAILHTVVVGYELTVAYVKRTVRKNTTRLDDYLELKTKDGQKVILKSLGITLHKVQRSVRTQIRRELANYYQEEMSKVDFETFVVNLTNGRLLSALKKKLHKLHPMKEIAVRALVLADRAIDAQAVSTMAAQKEEEQEPVSEALEVEQE